MKKTIPRHIIKLLRVNDKEKNLKSSQKDKIFYMQKNKDKYDIRFLLGNNASEKTVEQHLSNIEF